MLSPIPKVMLNDSFYYYSMSDDGNGYGEGTPTFIGEVVNVYITTTTQYVKSGDILLPTSVTRVFYDLQHSTPQTISDQFKLADYIVYMNVWYQVKSIHQAKGFNVNHLELVIMECTKPNGY